MLVWILAVNLHGFCRIHTDSSLLAVVWLNSNGDSRVIAERALQLERAGLPCSLDYTDSPCCANWSPTPPTGHYVSINGGIKLIKSNMKASASGKRCMFLFFAQSLAVLQQPPSDPEGVLLPAAAPPEDHRCRVGPDRCEGRPGRFSAFSLSVR